jgi:hypothetical protein
VDIAKLCEELSVQWYTVFTLSTLNHRPGHRVSLFCVVLVSMDVEQNVVMCVRVCDSSNSLTTCDTALCHFVNDCNIQMEQPADVEPRTKGPEQRVNSNVETKTVSAEPLAFEDPSAGGWAGYSQQIRYAIDARDVWRPRIGWNKHI